MARVKKVVKKKMKKVVPKKTGRKRGRPAGSFNKVKKKLFTELDDYVVPKAYKFLGYCPKPSCNNMIGSNSLVSKTIFICDRCGKRDRISRLKKELRVSGDRPKSKNEYLSDTIVHHEVDRNDDVMDFEASVEE